MSESENPCMHCGACCAWFRVSFYWAEGDDGGGSVPSGLTEGLTPFLRCMSGTNEKKPRCCALRGEVGHSVHCAIYSDRPSPCREFAMSGDGQQRNSACDRARAAYGLAPLPVAPHISPSEMTGAAQPAPIRMPTIASTSPVDVAAAAQPAAIRVPADAPAPPGDVAAPLLALPLPTGAPPITPGEIGGVPTGH
ncbi:YkgJ family cysteine cluster protein [Martelella alba]|uniref:YkgJ family cysteine cluster protein n=1 Tax=Martelella alba TaxID=2590451 RepID=A0ABY2ST01_9HYPH|nr:YkgJ family cysteine cluster protein [Martelella alba]TKI08138.1 YkgJ family cysteine cluster protein [Martelella alba]